MARYRNVPAVSGPPHPKHSVVQAHLQREIHSISCIPDIDRSFAFIVYDWPCVQRYHFITPCIFCAADSGGTVIGKNSAHALLLLVFRTYEYTPRTALDHDHGNREQRKKKVRRPYNTPAGHCDSHSSIWRLCFFCPTSRDLYAFTITFCIF